MARVGIKDVAAKAGVSIATVSHALRNPGRVSDQTRARVLAAVEEVGYRPNSFGVGLRTAKSGNIVAIIPDVSDSFNFKVIKAIEDVAYSRGYSVLLGDTQGSAEREKEYAAMASSRQVDGILLFSNRLPFDVKPGKPVSEQIPPLVNSCELSGHEGLPTVTIDNVGAAMDATRHLLDCGHRDIAVITGDINSTSSQLRLQGYRKAMDAASVPVNERFIIESDYTLQGGERGAQALLLLKQRPSAIFCFGDEMALGCIATLRTHGFLVPDDMSVMGFDDIEFARYFSPALTTIAQPGTDIGRICATMLLDLIDEKPLEQPQVIVPHQLIVRESTKSFQAPESSAIYKV